MPELRQLVMAALEPRRLATYYQEVFDLEKIAETRDTLSLSDGVFNLVLVAASDEQHRGLRQLSFETVRVEAIRNKLSYVNLPASDLIEVQSVSGIDCELRDPDGNSVGLCRRAFDTAFEIRPVTIRHVALCTRNARRLADFYCKVVGMKVIEQTEGLSIWVSDGYVNLALLSQRQEQPLGLDHFGFEVTGDRDLQALAEKAGMDRAAARPEGNACADYRVHDPEGNAIDISRKG